MTAPAPVISVQRIGGHIGARVDGVGWSAEDSRDLLGILRRQVTRPENSVRWNRRDGDLVFWDNRATRHYTVAGYGDLPRRVQRITLVGDAPVSVSGETSRAVTGDDTEYNTALARTGDGLSAP